MGVKRVQRKRIAVIAAGWAWPKIALRPITALALAAAIGKQFILWQRLGKAAGRGWNVVDNPMNIAASIGVFNKQRKALGVGGRFAPR